MHLRCGFSSPGRDGSGHAGIVFGQQETHYIGEWVNWLSLMHAVYRSEEMWNRVEYL